MKDIIPKSLFAEISDHLIVKSKSVARIWESSSDEEDSITGHFCGQLQTDWSRQKNYGNQGRWQWRVSYKKFRSKGAHAFEHIIGADGLFQIEIEQKDIGILETKGLLFQAKKYKLGLDSNLSDQVHKMEAIAKSASAVFVYGRERFQAISSNEYLNQKNTNHDPNDSLSSIGNFLGQEFLECRVGLRGMSYDGLRKILNVPGIQGSVQQYRVDVGHRVSVDVQKEE
jgi:hypothetical protein